MDDQRVPDLEELDEQQVRHFLAKLFSDLSAEAEYEMRPGLRNGDASVRRAHQGLGEDNPKRPALADAVLMYSTERFCDNVYIN